MQKAQLVLAAIKLFMKLLETPHGRIVPAMLGFLT